MSFQLRALVATAVLMTSAMPAWAAPLFFTVRGDYTADFKLDTDVNESFDGPRNSYVQFDFVPGTFQGALTDFASVRFGRGSTSGVSFYDQSTGIELRLYSALSRQVFSGTVQNPVFSPGMFLLSNLAGTSTLTISTRDPALPPMPVPSVPEPTTWAMMLVGFGLVGGTMRRRKSAVATRVSYAA